MKNSICINKLLILLFLFVLVVSIASCKSEGVDPEPDMPTVLFIGNSLTYASDIPEKLCSIASSKNFPISVQQVVHGMYKLSQHLENFKTVEDLKGYIIESDIIILQEYGKYQEDTVQIIKEFQTLFGTDKKYYFLETEYENFLPDEREKLTGIEFIRSGFVHDQLIENKTLQYEDLHKPNDFHPNELYGYIAAFTVFCKINGVSCDAFTVENILQIIGENNLPSNTTKAQSDITQKIQTAINIALEKDT